MDYHSILKESQNVIFADLEAETTQKGPKIPGSDSEESETGGGEEDDTHDHRWPTRSPIPGDNGDSKPYPSNRPWSNANSGGGEDGDHHDHRWPTRAPITPAPGSEGVPKVQSSRPEPTSSADLDGTNEDEHDGRWPTRAPITESEAQIGTESSEDLDETLGPDPQAQGSMTPSPFYYDDYYDYDTRTDSRAPQPTIDNPWIRRRMLRRSLTKLGGK